MKTPLLNLTRMEDDQLTAAIQCAANMHGTQFKSAIRRAWYSGNYRRESLEDHSGILQRLRNSRNGHEWLESLRAKDWVVNKATAYLMGRDAARGTGSPVNPFGVATLAQQWRNGFRDYMPGSPFYEIRMAREASAGNRNI